MNHVSDNRQAKGYALSILESNACISPENIFSADKFHCGKRGYRTEHQKGCEKTQDRQNHTVRNIEQNSWFAYLCRYFREEDIARK